MNSPQPPELHLSILDTVPIVEGSTAREALANTADLARQADLLGFRRYWVPEHHGMPGVAGAATSVIIEHLASATERIRVGSGGVLLPNHSPLVLAEQFGTLEAFHPGRIDLGIGRALGGRKPVVESVRPETLRTARTYEEQLAELISHFSPGAAPILAVPASGNEPQLWLLGSSDFSARLASKLGLPYAFAGHLNPSGIGSVLAEYRPTPLGQAEQGRTILTVPVIAADTDEQADWLAGSIKLRLLRRSRKIRGLLPTAEEAAKYRFGPEEERAVEDAMRGYIIGSGDTARAALCSLSAATGCAELMVTTPIHDHRARCRSYELLVSSG
ncbi:LLM class flavin-dependent oxidoreductase [Pseudonocardia sp. WMMC193]|uniref:LLM class flavin-dependent oxidoreductase n=1 Tax=Pseudonocardia sp. WMMC193 TaxID=2911965 RepID=UPI001F37960C|nr:LLM class flavin-dependent oxidoreductase [Pseudonocardia sp. WMMC193]MCF7547359.1 LLM class flavin-dependent oxidoreductase [Pseudonocardia sp. WMMC193]